MFRFGRCNVLHELCDNFMRLSYIEYDSKKNLVLNAVLFGNYSNEICLPTSRVCAVLDDTCEVLCCFPLYLISVAPPVKQS